MTESSETPADPHAQPEQPPRRRFSRPRPSLARYVLAVAAVAAVGATVLWGGLSAQMSTGKDPGLGEAAAGTRSTAVGHADPGVVVVGGDGEESGEGDDDGGVIVVGAAPAVAPTTPAPAPIVTQTPAPVQTTTS